jgi:hypothetical protein
MRHPAQLEKSESSTTGVLTSRYHSDNVMSMPKTKSGTRGGKIKAPVLVAYPSSELEREIVVEAARVVAGRQKPSHSSLMMEATITHIRKLPNKSPDLVKLLAQYDSKNKAA